MQPECYDRVLTIIGKRVLAREELLLRLVRVRNGVCGAELHILTLNGLVLHQDVDRARLLPFRATLAGLYYTLRVPRRRNRWNSRTLELATATVLAVQDFPALQHAHVALLCAMLGLVDHIWLRLQIPALHLFELVLVHGVVPLGAREGNKPRRRIVVAIQAEIAFSIEDFLQTVFCMTHVFLPEVHLADRG